MYKPAGGIKSKNVVAKPVRTGPGAKAVNKRWVSDIGQSKGNHVNSAEGGGKTLHGVRAYPHKGPSFNPGIQGNKVAAATVCGPGGSRVIYKSGGQHGLTTRQNKSDGRGFDD